jgi:hypothetical protein
VEVEPVVLPEAAGAADSWTGYIYCY